MKIFKLFIVLLFVSIQSNAQIKSTIVNVDSFFINGTMSIVTSKKILEKQFGKNYTKEKFQPECGFYADEQFYKVKFLLYKKNGMHFIVYNNTADFDQIDLTKTDSNFVQVGKFIINSKTTLSDLKKYFPKSYKEYEEKNRKNVKNSIFRLIYGNKSEDQFLIELNEKGNVVACSNWSPC